MKKFFFTLQAVLTLRQRAEQKALENYSRALLARDDAVKKLTGLERELAAGWELLRQQLSDGCQGARAAQTKASCAVLEEQKKTSEHALQQAERDLNAASHAMLHARQHREAAEKLQCAQRESYDREVRAEERKEIDDLVSRRARTSASFKLSENWN